MACACAWWHQLVKLHGEARLGGGVGGVGGVSTSKAAEALRASACGQ